MSSPQRNDGLTVFVGNLSYEATENEVKEHFESCGEISDIRVPTFPDSGRCRGSAFVTFASQDGVDKALALADSELLGRNLKVEVARGRSERPRRDFAESRPARGNFRQDRSPRRNDRPASEPSETVFVGNLAWAASERDLEDTFSSCGSIQAVRIPQDRETGRQKGFGYVTFDSVEAAQKAIEFSGTEIQGRSIRVDFASTRQERPRRQFE